MEVANRCEDRALANSIKNDFYVDDYLSGADSIEEAHVKVAKLCDELKKYGFELRKWTSSHHEITASFPESLRESGKDEKFMDENYKRRWVSSGNRIWIYSISIAIFLLMIMSPNENCCPKLPNSLIQWVG